ncbi:hypothetical protein CTAYLR_002679 [Chrysophaeum taylorii]|uniref:Calmodulin n=1 Tax=Chrysophaeum taylorii TaxID=2483200 RepID=A0AAD7UCT7_9STRA|nr:hypothetical protein CTAYLR_002679 [Chrysophaeum taylorii]
MASDPFESVYIPSDGDVSHLSTQELKAVVVAWTGDKSKVPMEKGDLRDAAERGIAQALDLKTMRELIARSGLSHRDCNTMELLRARCVAAMARLREAEIPFMARPHGAFRDNQFPVTWRTFDIVFKEGSLGLSIALDSGGNLSVVKVSGQDPQKAGLRPKDALLKINGCGFADVYDLATFERDVLRRLRCAPRPLKLTFLVGDGRWPPTADAVARPAASAPAPPQEECTTVKFDTRGTLGFSLGLNRDQRLEVSKVRELETSPCWIAGIKPGDELIAINGRKFGLVAQTQFDAVVQQLKQTPRPMKLTFKRNGTMQQQPPPSKASIPPRANRSPPPAQQPAPAAKQSPSPVKQQSAPPATTTTKKQQQPPPPKNNNNSKPAAKKTTAAAASSKPSAAPAPAAPSQKSAMKKSASTAPPHKSVPKTSASAAPAKTASAAPAKTASAAPAKTASAAPAKTASAAPAKTASAAPAKTASAAPPKTDAAEASWKEFVSKAAADALNEPPAPPLNEPPAPPAPPAPEGTTKAKTEGDVYRYDAVFPKQLLGIALALSRSVNDGTLHVEVTEVRPTCEATEVEVHDRLVAINGDNVGAVKDEGEFKSEILEKLKAAGRPLTLTFTSGVQGSFCTSQSYAQDLFDQIDNNGDGLISQVELIKALRKLPDLAEALSLPKIIRQEDGSRDAFTAVFHALAVRDDKNISKREWAHGLAKLASETII